MLGLLTHKAAPAARDPEFDAFLAKSREMIEYRKRIEDAVAAAGYDPEMLGFLSSGHIAAALALGVK